MKNSLKTQFTKKIYKPIAKQVQKISVRNWSIIGISAVAICMIIIGVFFIDREPTLQERYPDLQGRDLNAMLIREKTQKAADMVSVNPASIPFPVTSPLTVTGSARGSWYSKDSFPVELHDKNGIVIATGMAAAQDKGSKKSFIPFSVTLAFAPQES